MTEDQSTARDREQEPQEAQEPQELGREDNIEALGREVGTETRHETRADGSVAYFTTETGEEDVDRERAEEGIPAREVGTPTTEGSEQ